MDKVKHFITEQTNGNTLPEGSTVRFLVIIRNNSNLYCLPSPNLTIHKQYVEFYNTIHVQLHLAFHSQTYHDPSHSINQRLGAPSPSAPRRHVIHVLQHVAGSSLHLRERVGGSIVLLILTMPPAQLASAGAEAHQLLADLPQSLSILLPASARRGRLLAAVGVVAACLVGQTRLQRAV